MTLAGIFDRWVWIYRKGFLVLLAVAAVIQVPLAVVTGLVGQRVLDAVAPLVALSEEADPSDEAVVNALTDALPAIGGAVLVAIVVGVVAAVFLGPALIETASRIHSGSPVTIGDAYRAALRSAPAIFLGSIAVALVYLGLFLVTAVVAAVLWFSLIAADQAALGGLVILLAIVVLILVVPYVAIRWAVWNQAVVLEQRGPLDALRRSWWLVKGSMWRTAGLLFALGIVTAIANAILGAVGGIIGGPLPEVWREAVGQVLAVLTVSWSPIVVTLLFFDLRARHDMASASDRPVPPGSSYPPGPSYAPGSFAPPSGSEGMGWRRD